MIYLLSLVALTPLVLLATPRVRVACLHWRVRRRTDALLADVYGADWKTRGGDA